MLKNIWYYALIVLTMGSCYRIQVKTEPVTSQLNLAYLAMPQTGVILIALEKGYFAAEDLVVNPQPFSYGKLAVESVIRGDSDLAISAETPVILALLAGENLEIAATISSWDMNTAIVANRASGVQKPADLAGKAIGMVKGTSGEYFIDSFMSARGIDRNTVTLVELEPDSMLQSITSGMIAAAVIWVPTRLAISDGLGDQAMVFFGEDLYTEYLCVSGKANFLDSNPGMMRAFIRAIIRAEAFMKSNPVEAVAIITKLAGVTERNVRSVMDLLRVNVALDQGFLIQLEDETRWAMSLPSISEKKLPNFLGLLNTDALDFEAPARVRLIR